MKQLSPSKQIASKTIYEAFKVLKAEGGQLPGREVIDRIRQNLTFSNYEKEIYQTTGYVRWESILHFYTVNCIKAGFMRKQSGIWYLTPEGEAAMKKGPVELLDSVSIAYRKWAASRGITNQPSDDIIEIEENTPQSQIATLDQLKEQAIAGIKQFLNDKEPYAFQDFVAALLRAMGYHTPFISPKGKDGGIDIIAYQDALGINKPRIKVQVKHYPQNPITVDAVRSLKGLINHTEEVGLFITSGRFTTEAERFAREANVHIKLINGEELISLWQQFYLKLTDDDKNMLPLQPIYFLGVNEN